MPALNTITTNNRSAQNVDIVFTPIDEVNGVYYFADTSQSRVSQPTLTVSSRNSGDKTKRKIKYVLSVPEVETIDNVETVVRKNTMALECTFDHGSSESEVSDVVGMLVQSLYASRPFTHELMTKRTGIF